MNRLSWQRVWSIPAEQGRPTSLAWRPDGTGLLLKSVCLMHSPSLSLSLSPSLSLTPPLSLSPSLPLPLSLSLPLCAPAVLAVGRSDGRVSLLSVEGGRTLHTHTFAHPITSLHWMVQVEPRLETQLSSLRFSFSQTLHSQCSTRPCAIYGQVSVFSSSPPLPREQVGGPDLIIYIYIQQQTVNFNSLLLQ